jgi:tetratricopeptide (TPR) repeat protein
LFIYQLWRGNFFLSSPVSDDPPSPLTPRPASLQIREAVARDPAVITARAIRLSAEAARLSEDDNLSEAIDRFERAATMLDEALGCDAGELVGVLNQLGDCYRRQGRSAEAVASFARARGIAESSLGRHDDTAASLAHLAQVFHELGRLEEAFGAIEECLLLLKSLHGPVYPAIANALNDLAKIHLDQGNLVGARQAFEEALQIDSHLFGKDHPRIAMRLSNLGSVLIALGERRGAIEVLRRALTIRVTALGRHHPKTKLLRDKLQALEK